MNMLWNKLGNRRLVSAYVVLATLTVAIVGGSFAVHAAQD
jgi:hypothetical protein